MGSHGVDQEPNLIIVNTATFESVGAPVRRCEMGILRKVFTTAFVLKNGEHYGNTMNTEKLWFIKMV